MQTSENKQSEQVICKCPHCGASVKMYWHRLSPGLAKALIKFRLRVLALKRNKIHISTEVNFTKIEYANFQKLRYFGLVAKYKNPESKEHESGYWLLTKRGNLFCKNQLLVPMKVQTFRNKISDKSEETILLRTILKDTDLPIWDERDDFNYEFADIHEMEEIKFDINGQGMLFNQ